MSPKRTRSAVLLVDASINLLLGVLLLVFPRTVVESLGVPPSESGFYPSIFGAVLIGIGVALIVEWRQKSLVGLGVGGAMAINLCGGMALAGWLLFGDLGIPLRGQIFLWGLVVVLVGISGVEALMTRNLDGDQSSQRKE